MTLFTLGRGGKTAALVAAGATCLSLAVVTPAHADRAGDAPVTKDDRVTIAGNAVSWALTDNSTVDVLANDRDPNGETLSICRIEVPDDAPLHVGIEAALGEPVTLPALPARLPRAARSVGTTRTWSRAAGDTDGSRLSVASTVNRAGTYQVRYWACDFEYLTPATLTVTVKPSKVVRAKVLSGRHRVRFTNELQRPVRVEYVVPSRDGGIEKSVRIAPGRSKVIKAERRQLVWFARTLGRRFKPVGFGIIRGLRPRG